MPCACRHRLLTDGAFRRDGSFVTQWSHDAVLRAEAWRRADNAGVTAVDLELSRAGVGGPYESVASGLTNTGTYTWLVTAPATTSVRMP